MKGMFLAVTLALLGAIAFSQEKIAVTGTNPFRPRRAGFLGSGEFTFQEVEREEYAFGFYRDQ